MSRLKPPYGTTAELTNAVVQERDFAYDTTLDRFVMGDGVEAAGKPLAFRTEPAQVFTSGDATPSVANGHEFITTGSTPITNLDDGTVNQVVTLYRGDSDIIITDNANFTPIVAGDITLSASRASVSFRYTGSVWQEVSDSGLTSVPSALTAALAALDISASLTDVIEALTIDDYGDARWASLAEANVFESVQTAPSFTATEADNNATLRALRTGTATVDARVRAGATQAQFGSWTNHPVEFVINGSQVATISTAGVWSLSGALSGPNITSSVSGADSTLRSVRASGGDGRIVAGASSVEFGAYSNHGVSLIANAVSVGAYDTSGNLTMNGAVTSNVTGADATLRATRASGADARVRGMTASVEIGSYSAHPVDFMLNGARVGGLAASGAADFKGTTTNDNAAAGQIGELIPSTVLEGSAVSLTTATAANVTSISLTAGDWDVYGNVGFSLNGATTLSRIFAAINTTSAALPTPPGSGGAANLAAAFTTGTNQVLSAGRTRISVASTTTVYLVAQANFGVNTCAAFGYIAARRVR